MNPTPNQITECDMEIVTDNSKVIAELQRQNDELVARVARLEQAALIAIHALPGGDKKAEVRDIYDESPAQSLQHIEADAVERFANELGVYDSSYDDQEYVEVPRYRIKEYIAELRQQSSNDIEVISKCSVDTSKATPYTINERPSMFENVLMGNPDPKPFSYGGKPIGNDGDE